MRVDIPIVVYRKSSGAGRPYCAFPLFFELDERSHPRFARAVHNLRTDIRDHLRAAAQRGDSQRLIDLTFCPDTRLHRFNLVLDFRRTRVRESFHVVTFDACDRTIAMTPLVPDVWFEVAKGESLQQRTVDTLESHFSKLHKESPEQLDAQLERCRAVSKLWLTEVTIDVDPNANTDDETDLLTLFDATETLDGAVELREIGRCLDDLYPDGLSRSLGQAGPLQQLRRALEDPARWPVMIVGPSKVGKTALIEEWVYHRCRQRADCGELREAEREQMWEIAPGRLISGMKYVGQWENRLLAILKTVHERDHWLYIDDLLGMYSAGVTGRSRLSAATVLKAAVDNRELRLVSEMTPEEWRLFREKDRGFADRFVVIEVVEPSREDLWRILAAAVRRAESRCNVRFGADVIPAVVETTRRFQPDDSFPGKAIRWIDSLAVRFRGTKVGVDDFHGEFERKTGLHASLVKTSQAHSRAEIVSHLAKHVVGQTAAIEAMADVVVAAAARMNDPHRPLGSLLFLGPTGVGKTFCAKALATYLYGSEDRLLRFDMNEYPSADAASRLIGTFGRPDGVLTAAVRNEPYCVVLLDEIEKAHRDVHDLLLQILDDARLTDARGRIVDFSNAVIVLTSNLGSRAASKRMGFQDGDAHSEQEVYLRAVREFFRPEFVNRLDRIVPFTRLSPDEIRRIAAQLTAELTEREGLKRRKCAIDITPSAFEWIIEQGYDRQMGARAVRRLLERHLTQRISRKLAAEPIDRISVLTIERRGHELDARFVPLKEAEAIPEAVPWDKGWNPLRRARQIRQFAERVRQESRRYAPTGHFDYRNVTLEQEANSRLQCWIGELLNVAHSMEEDFKDSQSPPLPPVLAPRPPRRTTAALRKERSPGGARRVLKEMYSAYDVAAYVAQLADQPEISSIHENRLDFWFSTLEPRCGLLNDYLPGPEGWVRERFILFALDRALGTLPSSDVSAAIQQVRIQLDKAMGSLPSALHLGPHQIWLESRRKTADQRGWADLIEDTTLRERLAQQYGCRLQIAFGHGHRAYRQMRIHEGTYLVVAGDRCIHPVQIVVVPVQEDEEFERRMVELLRSTLPAPSSNSRDSREPLFAWKPVNAVITDAGNIDLRLGCSVSGRRSLWPLPPELQGSAGDD